MLKCVALIWQTMTWFCYDTIDFVTSCSVKKYHRYVEMVFCDKRFKWSVSVENSSLDTWHWPTLTWILTLTLTYINMDTDTWHWRTLTWILTRQKMDTMGVLNLMLTKPNIRGNMLSLPLTNITLEIYHHQKNAIKKIRHTSHLDITLYSCSHVIKVSHCPWL